LKDCNQHLHHFSTVTYSVKVTRGMTPACSKYP